MTYDTDSGFEQSLYDKPGDDTIRCAYADWQQDRGHEKFAAWLRCKESGRKRVALWAFIQKYASENKKASLGKSAKQVEKWVVMTQNFADSLLRIPETSLQIPEVNWEQPAFRVMASMFPNFVPSSVVVIHDCVDIEMKADDTKLKEGLDKAKKEVKRWEPPEPKPTNNPLIKFARTLYGKWRKP
jgi:uncharacterized protein (TIGR02996 family)